MISTELKMRIKDAIREYKKAEYDLTAMYFAAKEMCACLEAVLKENMNEMIKNIK